MRNLGLLIALGIAWSGSALASDGVIEINQTIATNGGVNGSLASDPAGFPVVITQPGHYQLTGNLSPLLLTAIQVSVPDVSIDLNGFAIQGSFAAGACPGVPVGFGVYSTQPGVAVENGQVSGMASQGVSLDGAGSRIERVTARANCSTGLWVGVAGIVEEGQAISNQGHGIVANDGSLVSRSTTRGNTLSGIFGFDNVRIVDSTAFSNLQFGIFATSSVVSGCTARSNNVGINVSGGFVRDSLAVFNTGVGINAYSVANNTTANNGTGILKVHSLDCNVDNLVRVCPPSP